MATTWKGQHTERRSKTTRMRTVETIGAQYQQRYKLPAATRHWNETVSCELSIDLDALLHLLASKAIGTKSGRTALAGGRIKLKITKRVESDVREEEFPIDNPRLREVTP